MRQQEMELLLAKGEYEVRNYFLCGTSARASSIDGTTLFLTNKRLVLEFMNNFEVSRREIPMDQILFIKSHYYEEEETPKFAIKCRNVAITSFVFASLLLVIGVIAFLNALNVISLFELNYIWVPFIPIAISIALFVLGGVYVNKEKKFRPRIGKKLELLIGTTLDFEQGMAFSTDSTKALRDNMRTYSGTTSNSLVGRIELSPTREAKKMINEIGALLIDIKAGLYDEDPEIREKRIKEEKEKKRREEAAALEKQKEMQKAEESKPKVATKINKQENSQIIKSKRPSEDPSKSELQKEREARMAKYGAPLEEIEEDDDIQIPSAMRAQYKKSKMPIPKSNKQRKPKTEDELLEEEYMAVINSLNLD